jgi:peptidoglycan hydrolase-like protein with peptidoglycan-binding domain
MRVTNSTRPPPVVTPTVAAPLTGQTPVNPTDDEVEDILRASDDRAVDFTPGVSLGNDGEPISVGSTGDMPLGLKLGARGLAVSELQTRLNLNPTGSSDAATRRELIIWQKHHGLAGTGEIDAATRAQMAPSAGLAQARQLVGATAGGLAESGAASALKMTAERGLKNEYQCAAGVHRALEAVGVPPSKNADLGSAYKYANYLSGDTRFQEVKVQRDELARLPPGAIIVYGACTPAVDKDGKPVLDKHNEPVHPRKHGHIAIVGGTDAAGRTLEYSDRTEHVSDFANAGPAKRYGTAWTDNTKAEGGDEFRVFIPLDTPRSTED